MYPQIASLSKANSIAPVPEACPEYSQLRCGCNGATGGQMSQTILFLSFSNWTYHLSFKKTRLLLSSHNHHLVIKKHFYSKLKKQQHQNNYLKMLASA